MDTVDDRLSQLMGLLIWATICIFAPWYVTILLIITGLLILAAKEPDDAHK